MKNKLFLLTLATSLVISIASCGKEATQPVVEKSTNIVQEDIDIEEPTSEVEDVEEPTSEIKDVNVAKVEETEVATITTEVEEATTEAEEITATETEEISDDYVWYVTDEEVAEISKDITNVDFVCGVYEFLRIHNPELKETDDFKYKCNEYVAFSNNGGSLLALVNEDFSKAYDIIEECGITVTTDTWGEMAANEVRMEVTDYDTFFEVLGKITEFSTGMARYSMKYSDGIDAINAGEVTDYAEAMSYLDGYDLYTYYLDGIDDSTLYYNDLIKYLH